jgi:hypothetical protein
VSGSLDFALMPNDTGLCRLAPNFTPQNSHHAYCTDPTGADFPSRTDPTRNAALLPGNSGTLNGGFGTPDVRFLFAADYALAPSILVGARLGYVFGTYTGEKAPHAEPEFRKNLHAEVRATYLFGADPLAHVGFSPMVFAALGTSAFDGHSQSSVTLSGVAGRMPVDVWVVGGPWFVGAGGGVRYQFSPRIAFTAAARANVAFGVVGTLLTVGPELGIAYGF